MWKNSNIQKNIDNLWNKTKNINKQKFTNHQENIKISAWWNVYNGIHNHQEFIDNWWYIIPKEETELLEKISKFIFEYIGKVWWIFGWISSVILWLYGGFTELLMFMGKYKPIITQSTGGSGIIVSNSQNFLLYVDFWGTLLCFLIALIWVLILHSIQHKILSQCKKCKTDYALVEVWESKQKEIQTSKGLRKETIRNYKCKKCGDITQEKVSSLIMND